MNYEKDISASELIGIIDKWMDELADKKSVSDKEYHIMKKTAGITKILIRDLYFKNKNIPQQPTNQLSNQ